MNKTIDILKAGTSAHSFVYKDTAYFFHASVRNPDIVLTNNDIDRDFRDTLQTGLAKNSGKNLAKGIIVALITKVFDEPLLGGVKAKSPAGKKEAKEINAFLSDMNGVEFWKGNWEFMGHKKLVHKLIKDGNSIVIDDPDKIHPTDFLAAVCAGYYIYLVGRKLGKDEIGLTEVNSLSETHYFQSKEMPEKKGEYSIFALWV